MNKHSSFYTSYIHSKKWYDRRDQLFAKRGKRCEACGTTKYIQVHHKTYERLGHEADGDLVILCKSCHKKIHSKKSSWVKRVWGWIVE